MNPQVTAPLLLASTSRYRRELLERLRIPFRCLAPMVEERGFKTANAEPATVAAALALAKAESLTRIMPEAIIIGSDQVVNCDGRILGKPGSRMKAIEQLARLSGRDHQLITAVAVCHAGRTLLHLDETRMTMRRLSPDAIIRYVDQDRPLDCAGSYRIESLGIALFESIVTDDHTAIVGLPLMTVADMLNQVGLEIP